MADIIIHKFKEMNLKGATIINGFPSLGLVSTITANYLIGALKLDQIGAMDSEDFPPVSMVYAAKPKYPARIYACCEKSKIAVFLSEFTPMPHLVRPIARAMLSWSKEQKCARIVAPEVVSFGEEQNLEVFGVGSTDRTRAEMKKLEITPFVQGMVSGITGVLLNEGRRADFDVYALLAQARPGMPDARAAANIIKVISMLEPAVKVDVGPLYEEAEKIEEYVKTLREQARPATEPSNPPNMYR